VAILFAELSPYMLACWRALIHRHEFELLVVHLPTNMEAPFDLTLEGIVCIDRRSATTSSLMSVVRAFGPDALLVSGWGDRGYRHVARRYKSLGVPVIMGIDTQWENTLRQRAAATVASHWLGGLADVLWVPGERQVQMAARLGFTGLNCWEGVYCCDWDAFAVEGCLPRKSFLYVGRFVESKGIRDLLWAYDSYRSRTTDPWPLFCAGTGRLEKAIHESPGVTSLGFVQPGHLPSVLRRYGGALILPSRIEPWGVILQEAAASGLPLICSDACGAAPHLAHNYYNALRFKAGRKDELAACLELFTSLVHDRRREMGLASIELAKTFQPKRWAQTLVDGLERLRKTSQPIGRAATASRSRRVPPSQPTGQD